MTPGIGAVWVSALCLSVTACAEGESPASLPSGDAAELTVMARDIGFPERVYRAQPGQVAVVYRNEGSIKHTLLIEDIGGFKLAVQSKGDVDRGAVALEAGEYTLYCDVPGHRQAGMEAILEVS